MYELSSCSNYMPLRDQGGITADMATPLSYHCCFDGGATAIIGGTTAVLAAALRGQLGATAGLAVLLRRYYAGAVLVR